MSVTIAVNKEVLTELQADRSLKEFAADLEVDASTLSRLINGKSEPGPRIMAAFLTTYPHKFEHFFTVTDVAS